MGRSVEQMSALACGLIVIRATLLLSAGGEEQPESHVEALPDPPAVAVRGRPGQTHQSTRNLNLQFA